MPNLIGVDETGHRVSFPYTVTGTPPPPQTVAQFSRVLYAAGGFPPKHNYKAIVIQGKDSAQASNILNSIPAGQPKPLIFTYVDAIWANPAPWEGIPADPAWTAKDASGNVLNYQGQAGQPLAQVDSPLFQSQWVAHAISQAQTNGCQGVFFDDITANYMWNTPGHVAVQYPTMASWQAALVKFVQAVCPQLKAAGLLSFLNIGGATVGGLNKPDPFWVAAAGAADWAMEESWINGGQGLLQQVSGNPVKMANVAWSDAHGKGVMLRNDDATAAGNTLGLACMLIVGSGNATYATSNTSYSQELWFPVYDTALQLGTPIDPPQTTPRSNGLWVRNFQNGVVTANPTGASVSGMAATSATIT